MCQIKKMCLRRIFISICALSFVDFKVSMCYYGTILPVSTMGSPTSLLPSPIQRRGYGRSLFCEMFYPHRTSNSFFPALQSSCKGFGWIWIQRPRFLALPIPQIKGSGLLLPCSTCPLITKDTACPRITIASRNWHHLMPGICTFSGGPSTHP